MIQSLVAVVETFSSSIFLIPVFKGIRFLKSLRSKKSEQLLVKRIADFNR